MDRFYEALDSQPLVSSLRVRDFCSPAATMILSNRTKRALFLFMPQQREQDNIPDALRIGQ